MSFKTNTATYNNLTDYRLNGVMEVNAKYFFDPEFYIGNWKNDMEIAKKRDFQGIYTYSLKDDECNEDTYEFVCANTIDEDGETILFLIPTWIPNEELFTRLEGYEVDCDVDTEYLFLSMSYSPYNKEKYKTKDDELVDFYGFVRKIEEEDCYVTDNGINYQVCEEVENAYKRPIKAFIEDGSWDEMVKDNFMGTYITHMVYCTGEFVDDPAVINYIDDEYIYLTPTSIRNDTNRAEDIIFEDDDGVMIIKSSAKRIDDEYIPFQDGGKI